jgi:Fur family transcriptional regulator, peroxide stress response regulator
MDADAIKHSLADSGLRSTPQRYALMAFLTGQATHPTAAEIFEAVNRIDPRSSRATVYNNLRDLVQAGLVREVADRRQALLAVSDNYYSLPLPHCECYRPSFS